MKSGKQVSTFPDRKRKGGWAAERAVVNKAKPSVKIRLRGSKRSSEKHRATWGDEAGHIAPGRFPFGRCEFALRLSSCGG
jgi:hypothetical protein